MTNDPILLEQVGKQRWAECGKGRGGCACLGWENSARIGALRSLLLANLSNVIVHIARPNILRPHPRRRWRILTRWRAGASFSARLARSFRSRRPSAVRRPLISLGRCGIAVCVALREGPTGKQLPATSCLNSCLISFPVVACAMMCRNVTSDPSEITNERKGRGSPPSDRDSSCDPPRPSRGQGHGFAKQLVRPRWIRVLQSRTGQKTASPASSRPQCVARAPRPPCDPWRSGARAPS